MERTEAELLVSYICIERKPEAVRVHQIGSGEHVVLLVAECYYLWSLDDWTAFRERRETAGAKSHRRDRATVNGTK
jgi:hypothetical protein